MTKPVTYWLQRTCSSKKLMFALDASLVAQTVKSLSAMQEAPGSILGSGRFPGKEMATHSSILAWKNPMDKGAWWAIVHGVTKSQTGLGFKKFCFTLKSFVLNICFKKFPSLGKSNSTKNLWWKTTVTFLFLYLHLIWLSRGNFPQLFLFLCWLSVEHLFLHALTIYISFLFCEVFIQGFLKLIFISYLYFLDMKYVSNICSVFPPNLRFASSFILFC